MKVISPLGNFNEVLTQVNDVAAKYSARLKNNEAATRAALIDPILKALGWDISNPDMVELEKGFGNTRLDYALLDHQGKVALIVEAKALGSNLTDPKLTAQVFTYCFNYAIQNTILTDGIVWHHYLQVTPGNMNPDCIDITKDGLSACADFFIRKLDAFHFWTPSTVVSIVTPVLQKPSQPVIVPPPPNPTLLGQFTPLSALPANFRDLTAPKSLCLPDGSVIPIHYWRDILVECVKFVLKVEPGIPIPLPDKAGQKITLLSYGKHRDGAASTQVLYNGKTVYVYLHYAANNCVANAQYILGYLPKNKNWQPVEVAF